LPASTARGCFPPAPNSGSSQLRPVQVWLAAIDSYEAVALLLPPRHGCAAVGYERTVTIELPEPSRGRPVVDGATGEQRPVIDAALLLTPSWLPAGYRFVRERVEFGIDFREWAPDGRPDVRLLVDQGDADKLARPGFDPVVLGRPVVRGVPATVWKTRLFDDSVCVSWAEGSMGHRVCTSGAPEQLLSIQGLVGVADGLRD
jgi:hypothetical protein